MDYSLESFTRDDYVVIVVTGQYTGENADNFTSDIDKLYVASGKDKILLDMRNTKIITNVFSEFQRFSNVIELETTKASKFAVLSVRENRQMDSFVETANRNRGVNLVMFYDETEAIKWLTASDSIKNTRSNHN